jgi:hypothetical protein
VQLGSSLATHWLYIFQRLLNLFTLPESESAALMAPGWTYNYSAPSARQELSMLTSAPGAMVAQRRLS